MGRGLGCAQGSTAPNCRHGTGVNVSPAQLPAILCRKVPIGPAHGSLQLHIISSGTELMGRNVVFLPNMREARPPWLHTGEQRCLTQSCLTRTFIPRLKSLHVHLQPSTLPTLQGPHSNSFLAGHTPNEPLCLTGNLESHCRVLAATLSWQGGRCGLLPSCTS